MTLNKGVFEGMIDLLKQLEGFINIIQLKHVRMRILLF